MIIAKMKHTRLTLVLTLCLTAATAAVAQPASSRKALLTLHTYKSGGTPVATAYGCLLSADGTAVSSWSPFDGADSAVVVDAAGRSHRVEKIYGASELYDIAKFQIANASGIAVMPKAKSVPSASAKLWVVTDNPQQVALSRAEKFMTKYNYYVLGDKMELKNDKEKYPNGSPVVDAQGSLVGIYNNGSSVLSATDYRYCEELQPSGFSNLDATLRRTTIRKALPSDLKNARIALMSSANGIPEDYAAAARDFMRLFPKENDGYFALAGVLINQGKLDEADKILQEAIATATDKAEAHYNYSRLMWRKTAVGTEPLYPAWTFDKAMTEADAAYKANPQPLYDEMRGKILFSQKKYGEAYDKFMALTKSALRNPELFYEAAQCRQQLGAKDEEVLALLDSAVNACDTPYTSIAAPYFEARGMQYSRMGKYRDAMLDLYRYEILAPSQPSAAFYYEREQIEMKGRVFQSALNDIARAIILDPKNATLWAEKANVHLRVNQLDDAVKSADIALKYDDAFASAYLIKGIAQCQSGNKAEGIANLEKAKELGDTQASTFIEKYK